MLFCRRLRHVALSLNMLCLVVAPALAETSPTQPAATQPTLPTPLPAATSKPGSPVVEQIMHPDQPPLVVRKQASRPVPQRRRRIARHIRVPRELDRPALAGVELVAPLPPPGEPPHITVPLPAYSLDSLAAAYLTPPPPIVCHPTRRDRYAPDPHLYKEVPVDCEPDNP